MSPNCESKERRANQRGHGGGINLQFKMGIEKVGPRFSPAAGAGHAGEPVHQSVAEGGAHRGHGTLGSRKAAGVGGVRGPGGCGGGRTRSMTPAVALLGVECRPMVQRIWLWLLILPDESKLIMFLRAMIDWKFTQCYRYYPFFKH
jgi:hypothetical protein